MKMKKLTVALIALLLMGTLTACGDRNDESPSSIHHYSSISDNFRKQPLQSSISTTSSKQEETVHPEVKKLVDDFLEANRKCTEAQNDYNAFERKYGGFDNIPPEQYQTAIGMLTDVQEKAKVAQTLAQEIADLQRTRSDLNDKDLEYCQKAMAVIANQ